MAKTCGATVNLDGGVTLTCGEKPGHPGPVHDDDGHVWGDQALPPVAPEPVVVPHER